jgi:hypothetical protein
MLIGALVLPQHLRLFAGRRSHAFNLCRECDDSTSERLTQ